MWARRCPNVCVYLEWWTYLTEPSPPSPNIINVWKMSLWVRQTQVWLPGWKTTMSVLVTHKTRGTTQFGVWRLSVNEHKKCQNFKGPIWWKTPLYQRFPLKIGGSLGNEEKKWLLLLAPVIRKSARQHVVLEIRHSWCHLCSCRRWSLGPQINILPPRSRLCFSSEWFTLRPHTAAEGGCWTVLSVFTLQAYS